LETALDVLRRLLALVIERDEVPVLEEAAEADNQENRQVEQAEQDEND
jgi:hypothetical protein